MNSNEAKKIIEKCFENPYNEENFKDFIINIFKNNPEIKNENFQGAYIKNAFSDYVKSYKRLFKYQSPDIYQDKIDILAVNLKNSQTIQKSRTLQRNFIASYLEQRDKDAVLVAFYSDENLSDWKFSYITRKLIDSDNKIKSQYTSPRRMTFLVGENEKSHTAKKQFLPILQESKTINLPILEQAFSTEIVTNEFFEKYKELYHLLREALEDLCNKDPKIKNDFIDKQISDADFAKKTLGQIAFLYFLQKKGWFGVNENADWGTGDKNFLQKIFKNKKPTENFFNDILEPLFYSALAVDRGNLAMYEKLNCRMPFLNGGLFEPLNGYLWEGTNINLPDHLFSNTTKTKDGDIGDGILDIFNRYNFTVCENEPLEKEVAVDPEMLGKVFENLLEIKDRKSKGAFYTPREIVHYMCQETLINFLDNQLNHTISKEDLEFYIKKGDEIIENDKMVIANGKETETYKFKLPAPIYQHSQRIDQLLCNIKVCDPAVGSGAFMLGMLNEIVKARSVLQHYLTKSQDIYSLKLHTIANSIYGVDLDSGAVEITKLRLWLALVVEEREPSPLPNLDHKIMQGNSLLEEYEGIKLFDENILQNSDSQKNQILKIENRLKELNLKIIDQGKKSIQKSKNLEFIKLNDEQQKLQKSLEKLQTKNSSEISLNTLFDDQQQSQYLASLTAELQQKVSQFIFENQRTKKENLKKEIDNLKYQLIEETLKQQNKTEKLAEIKKLRQKNIRQFFIWRLEFCDVFSGDNPGFDVVIGNPPYIQLQKEGGKLAKIYQKSQFESFVKSGDIYCLFYEFGNLILNQNGHLAFITSNKWMRAGYGKKLRKFLSENTQPKILIDLGSGVFKTATVDTNILLYQKKSFIKNNAKNSDNSSIGINCLASTIKENLTKTNQKIEDYLAKNHLYLQNFSSESWIISNQLEAKIKAKIEKIGVKLKDWDVKINYGIKTGFNEAFIIDTKTKDEICRKDPKSAEIIKPILRGRDISRYSAKWAGLWVINAHNGYKINSTNNTDSNKANEIAISNNPPLDSNKANEIAISNNPPLDSNKANEIARSNNPPLEGGSKLLAISGRGYKTENLQFAKEMRKEMTKQEFKLWNILKSNQLGFKFRRQHPIGSFIVDFCCLEKKLVIELDGSQHIEQEDYDNQRTAFLNSCGFKVIRFWNNEFMKNIDGCAEFIIDCLNDKTPPQISAGDLTLPQGEGYLTQHCDSTLKTNLNIPRIDVEKDYPAIFKYLLNFKEQLQNRTDKGEHWTNLRNCAYLEEFEKEKIVWQELTQGSSFFLDSNNCYVANTGYIMTGKYLRFLIAVLNSKILEKLFRRFYSINMGDKGLRWLNQYVEQIPIPQITEAEQQPFIALVDEILSITNHPDYNPDLTDNALMQRQKQLEAKIDEMVCDLYQLDEEERKLVLNC